MDNSIKEIRLIVAGSRDYTNKKVIENIIEIVIADLKQRHPFFTLRIITGGARGVDTLAENYARTNGIKLSIYPVTSKDWATNGKAAGPLRNARMAEAALEADAPYLLAFWDMKSRGTKSMIDIANKKHIPTYVYDTEKEILSISHM